MSFMQLLSAAISSILVLGLITELLVVVLSAQRKMLVGEAA
jgi:hypothetical protein